MSASLYRKSLSFQESAPFQRSFWGSFKQDTNLRPRSDENVHLYAKTSKMPFDIFKCEAIHPSKVLRQVQKLNPRLSKLWITAGDLKFLRRHTWQTLRCIPLALYLRQQAVIYRAHFTFNFPKHYWYINVADFLFPFAFEAFLWDYHPRLAKKGQDDFTTNSFYSTFVEERAKGLPTAPDVKTLSEGKDGDSTLEEKLGKHVKKKKQKAHKTFIENNRHTQKAPIDVLDAILNDEFQKIE